MANIITAPKGVPDYVPPLSRDFFEIRHRLSLPAQLAGYGYIELPVYEDTALYVRGVGESTDVVSKEMFTFTDRGERSITLRPEGTAGVMRAVIEHGLDRGQLPIKLWYAGPFFRAERPQAGRYRQLQQVGVEAIGSDDPALDAEVIALADEAYRRVGLTQFTLKLTSLGCSACRPSYRGLLQSFLAELPLDEATQERAKLNPLRVLDDKRAEVQSLLERAPLQVDHICSDCQQHYNDVRHFLTLNEVSWVEAPRMVRGLDYYTRTTFEFDHPLLGAQSGIGGGGRYDGLMTELGGNSHSGIGFGLGTDRTLLAAQAEGIQMAETSEVDVFIIAMGMAAKAVAVQTLHELRTHNIRAAMAFGDRSLKASMKSADKTHAPFIAVLGDDEMAASTISVKRVSDNSSHALSMTDFVSDFSNLLEELHRASHS
jgi:histidyl-tRNA synthetase